ncbi:MAG: hypothetical protein DRP83_06030 [Planctomycetota bacterium]|nr:MAG: hypothetical protein DRP83_06030 [Planctomycetota bacterium]
MIAILDTSAVIRLFIADGPIPAGLETFLGEVERGNAVGLAPELLWVEAANVLLRKKLRGELAGDEAEALLEEIIQLPLRRAGHVEILPRAMELADAEGLSVYDALFLSLAELREGVVFTADQQLAEASRKLGLAPRA